jgi:phage FluMu protein Com
MNDKKCNYCNKLLLNTHKNALIINKKICKCKVIKQDENNIKQDKNNIKQDKNNIKQDKNNIKQDEEINYDLKNLIKELIIHKYFT